MKGTTIGAAVSLALAAVVSAADAQGAYRIDRTVLPIREPDPPRVKQLDARDATAPARFEVQPPKGAPNVLVFLIDDMGFGHPSTFGGDVPMPTLDRLASQGFGTTASTPPHCAHRRAWPC